MADGRCTVRVPLRNFRAHHDFRVEQPRFVAGPRVGAKLYRAETAEASLLSAVCCLLAAVLTSAG